jgi:tetratricopeptide (TPR) repeat protein
VLLSAWFGNGKPLGGDLTTRIVVREAAGMLNVGLLNPGSSSIEWATSSHAFRPPLSPQASEEIRWYLEDSLRSPYGAYQDRKLKLEGRLPEIGLALFDCLFPGGSEALELFGRAVGMGDYSLWFQSESDEFMSVPWELLRFPQTDSSPLGIETQVTRSIAAAALPRTFTITGPVRILLVIARPAGIRDVSYQIIGRRILDRLQVSSDRVEVTVLRPPTLLALKQALSQARNEGRPFHILHFDGHGTIGPLLTGATARSRQGYLVFEGGGSGSDPVPASELVALLTRHHVPLLVLNACRGAHVSDMVHVSTSVATSMISAGAASVVAMSHIIFPEAAAEFADGFYGGLASGATISESVRLARQRLALRTSRTSWTGTVPLQDWFIPVHYASSDLSFDLTTRAQRSTRTPTIETETVSSEAGAIVFVGRDAEILELEHEIRAHRVIHVYGVLGAGKSALVDAFVNWLSATGGITQPALVHHLHLDEQLVLGGVDAIVSAFGRVIVGDSFVRDNATPEMRRETFLGLIARPGMVLVLEDNGVIESTWWRELEPLRARRTKEDIASFLRSLEALPNGLLWVISGPLKTLSGFGGSHVGGLVIEQANELGKTILSALPDPQAHDRDPNFAQLMLRLAGHPAAMHSVLPLLELHPPQELLKNVSPELLPTEIGQPLLPALRSFRESVHAAFIRLPERAQKALVIATFSDDLLDFLILSRLESHSPIPQRLQSLTIEDWSQIFYECSAVGLSTPGNLNEAQMALHPALSSYVYEWWKTDAGASFAEEYEQTLLAYMRSVTDVAVTSIRGIREGLAQRFIQRIEAHSSMFARVAREALARDLYEIANLNLRPLYEMFASHGDIDEVREWASRVREKTEAAGGQPPDPETPQGALWLVAVTQQAGMEARFGNSLAVKLYDEVATLLHTARPSPEDTDRHRLRLSNINYNLAQLAIANDDLNRAEALARDVLQTSIDLNYELGEASGYNLLGTIEEQRGHIAEAEAYQSQAADIQERLGNLAATNLSVASLPGGVGLEHALDVAIGLGDLHQQEVIHNRLGIIAIRRNDPDLAETHFQSAARIGLLLNDHAALARIYLNLGALSLYQGTLQRSEEWLEGGAVLARDAKQMRTLVSILGLLARVRSQRGKWSDALHSAVECWSVARTAKVNAPSHVAATIIFAVRWSGFSALEKAWESSFLRPLPRWLRDHIMRQLASASPQVGKPPGI